MMICIHAESLLWDLRSVLAAVTEHNTTLEGSTLTEYAELTLVLMIERLEDGKAGLAPGKPSA